MRKARGVVLAAIAITLIATLGAPAASAAPAARGEGSLFVRDTPDCSGTGSASTVVVPFSLFFTGFEPFTDGTVTAYTQPGGVEVGSITATTDANGQLCIRVDGNPPPGQYKIVYEFDDGTGKQKVIRIESGGPGATPTPSPTPSLTTTPTTTPTPTGTPTSTSTPTTTPTPSATPTGTPTPTATPTSSTTPTPSPTATDSASPTPAPTPTDGTLVLSVVELGDELAETGGTNNGQLVLVAVALLGLGCALVLGSRRRS